MRVCLSEGSGVRPGRRPGGSKGRARGSLEAPSACSPSKRRRGPLKHLVLGLRRRRGGSSADGGNDHCAHSDGKLLRSLHLVKLLHVQSFEFMSLWAWYAP